MFDKLHRMLIALQEAKGSNAKKELLKTHLLDADFVWMAGLALDQGYSFGISEFPAFNQAMALDADPAPSYRELKEALEKLKDARGVSDGVLEQLWELACTSEGAYIVTTLIVRKDLRCGVSAKTINKLRPGTVHRVPYQRCSGYDRIGKMTWPAMLQRKANGMFSYMSGALQSFMTRAGNAYTIPGNPITPFLESLPGVGDKILIGELVVLAEDEETILDRAVGNGLLNSFVNGTGDPSVAPRVRAFVWGWVTPEEFAQGSAPGRSYLETWRSLCGWLPFSTPDTGGGQQLSPVRVIESWFMKDLDEAQAKFKELIAIGEEGGIVKSLQPDFIWQDEDSCDFQIKLKAEAEAEFEIIDAYEGDAKKKYAGKLGGIRVRSADGLIETDVGGGFTDAQRNEGVEAWRARAGQICTIKFNGITTDQNRPGIHALDHPRFIEPRADKTVADTLEYCQLALKGGPTE